MSFIRTPHVYVLTGFVALFAFAGDIVADSIADARGNHCISQSSEPDSHHEKKPCSHCSCDVHNGAVVIANSAVHVSIAFEPAVFLVTSDESAPARLPASIDHPPQLA